MESPRVCIVGAGSSGIAAAKVLHEQGIEFDCYELSDRVGGNWVFDNRNGVSSSYRSLHINTSRERMEFSDFPMPASYPDFPRHDQIAAYFEAYVDHFGFRERIQFETGVAHVERGEDGTWLVELSTGETLEYDAVLVANGHHWDPRWPESDTGAPPPVAVTTSDVRRRHGHRRHPHGFPGEDTFTGELMHSHFYRDESQLAGKRVVVLGMGNSAMDIAVDASYHARSVVLAGRRGAHILPKYLFGKPMDQIGGSEGIPSWVRWPLVRAILKLNVGDLTKYGLPEPDHRFGEAHPTISGRILDRLAHGAIDVKPNIARFEGDRVHFTDGTSVEADLVVYCTGYKITFPFFDEDLVSARDNQLDLYKHLVHPSLDGLYFIGLVQPLGAIMPIAERQSQLVARHLRGAYALPSEAEMRRDIARKRDRMRKRYVASKRHTIQVDFDDYMRELRKETEAGARRPARRPLPARAREAVTA